MKPDWKDAPEWVEYRAQDFNGNWHWFECEPHTETLDREWVSEHGSDSPAHPPSNNNWKQTLEKRP